METLYQCHVTYTRTEGGQAVGRSGWLNTRFPTPEHCQDRAKAAKLTGDQMVAMLKLIDLPFDQELVSFTAYPVRK